MKLILAALENGRPSLLEEAENFEQTTGIALDPNYNAKVWAYLQRTSLQGKVVWIHTGGVRF
jgi:1-aminocyclopropane-1-carboxylate deaminase/D-cysteine desulfhydrase-like pyridoxal-dependent ACC family enzyme